MAKRKMKFERQYKDALVKNAHVILCNTYEFSSTTIIKNLAGQFLDKWRFSFGKTNWLFLQANK
jgi:hypothetical protein